MNETIRTAIEKSAKGEIPYPVLARTLLESGVRSYHVDVATHTAVYRGDGDPFTIQGKAVAIPGEPPTAFQEEKVKAAILANQRREIDYEGFLQRIWQNGTIAYDVDLAERTVTYRGRDGEAYVERIPLPES